MVLLNLNDSYFINHDSICFTWIHWSVTGSLISGSTDVTWSLFYHSFPANFRLKCHKLAQISVSWSISYPFVVLEYPISISMSFLDAISSIMSKNQHFHLFFVLSFWNKFPSSMVIRAVWYDLYHKDYMTWGWMSYHLISARKFSFRNLLFVHFSIILCILSWNIFLIYICRFDDQRRLNTFAPKSLKTESRRAMIWKYKIAESRLLTQQKRVVYLPDDLSYEIVSDVLIAVINIYSHFYCAHSRLLMGFWKFLRSEIFIRVRSG